MRKNISKKLHVSKNIRKNIRKKLHVDGFKFTMEELKKAICEIEFDEHGKADTYRGCKPINVRIITGKTLLNGNFDIDDNMDNLVMSEDERSKFVVCTLHEYWDSTGNTRETYNTYYRFDCLAEYIFLNRK